MSSSGKTLGGRIKLRMSSVICAIMAKRYPLKFNRKSKRSKMRKTGKKSRRNRWLKGNKL
jgi:hypothetical protein|tara:strand:+ start:274 stop:453 length:180 start_codon:yes stop_codon:yes gene_type:complete